MSGMPRVRSDDCNRSEQGYSRPQFEHQARRRARFSRRRVRGSAKRFAPGVRGFRGGEFGESQKDLLRACAREEIDINIPFEGLPKTDQDFVISGEKRSGEYTDDDYENDRWYGVRGFFRWLESKTYKMHVRVLLSRYRAYTTCPSCNGGRFQPEALNFKIVAAYDRRPNSSDARTAP